MRTQLASPVDGDPTVTGRSRAWRIGFVAAGLLVIAVVVGVALTLRDTARPVTVDEARGRTTTTTSGSGTGTDEPSSPPRPVAGVYQYELGLSGSSHQSS